MVLRTKIKQKPEDVLEFDDEPKLIYPKILELPDREQKTRKRRATFDPQTRNFSDDMETFQ